MSSNRSKYDENLVNETGYNDRLKRQCMYNILNRYSNLLRPGIYTDDTRTIFLMTMCRLIDRSKELNSVTKIEINENSGNNDGSGNGNNNINDEKKLNQKNNRNNNNNNNNKNDNDDNDDEDIWRLAELSVADAKGLFDESKSAAVPGRLTPDERLRRLERILLDPNVNQYI